MKKDNLKFGLSTDWIFEGMIDAELKQYVLLGYFQKLNKQVEEMKVYPMFTEITLHLANVQNIIKKGKILYTDKKLKSYDDELTFKDLKSKDLPNLNESEKIQLKQILDYSSAKIQDYFDIVKSVWTIVYDCIEIISILNEDNIKSKKGYYYTKYDKNLKVWEYSIKKVNNDNKFSVKEKFDPDLFMHIISKENKLPTFFVHCDKDVPFDETLEPLLKRKIMSFVLQSKNLIIQ